MDSHVVSNSASCLLRGSFARRPDRRGIGIAWRSRLVDLGAVGREPFSQGLARLTFERLLQQCSQLWRVRGGGEPPGRADRCSLATAIGAVVLVSTYLTTA